jgi:Mg2+ and Co2+ transporter CorA|tara:strand:- start:3303 stop:3482 length:180 start_codon:yes stop_codon:yes gene_type:complete
MSKALTEEVKERLKNLQEQKDDLKEDLEMVTYTKNLRKVEAIEQEIYEIEDTMKKLRGE